MTGERLEATIKWLESYRYQKTGAVVKDIVRSREWQAMSIEDKLTLMMISLGYINGGPK